MKLLHLFFVFFSCSALSSQDFWADYHLTASVRATNQSAWVMIYSEPFGVRLGYGAGLILQDLSAASDPKAPTCYSFSFSPLEAKDLISLEQNIEVSEFRGSDSTCNIADPSQVATLLSLNLIVMQNQKTTFNLPYLSGKQIHFELVQTWKPVP